MGPTPRSPMDRTLDKFSVGDGCWNWLGATVDSYGHLRVKSGRGLSGRAHRIVFEALRGPIQSGLVLDHLCRNKACVRPSHLEPVTNRENVARGDHRTNNAMLRRQSCPSGHPYSSSNTLPIRTPSGLGRQCRECNRLRNRRLRAERKIA